MPNIFSEIPKDLSDENFEELIVGGKFKLERIISKGQATPKNQWLSQEQDEWVILLKGSAGLTIEGKKQPVTLKPGDYIHLPANGKHRVEWTDPKEETVWLALHYE